MQTRCRTLLVGLLALLAPLAAWAVLGAEVRAVGAVRTTADAVQWLAAVLLLGCVSWGAATAVLVVIEASTPALSCAGVPPAWRRLVLLACGLALAGTTAPAHATPGALPVDDDQRHPSVAGLPLPDRTLGTASDRLHVPPQRAADHALDHALHVVVRPGDSLWTLSERHGGDGSAWPRLYAANRAVIGPDPDLIRPGQRLVLPATDRSDSSERNHR